MTAFAHSLAVVIGIDAYGHGIPRLTTAVNDAKRLAELLQAEHSYETILLTGEATGPPVTQERLRTLFNQDCAARLGPDDRLLVYFAGHGVALDGDDGPAGYLVPQGAQPDNPSSLLAMTDLHRWLTDLPCRHMLAILDCCFAGAFRWAATRHAGDPPEVIHKERFDRYLRSPAWQVITSASYDQKALDVLTGNVVSSVGTRQEDGRWHSPFAQALFDALKGAGDLVPKGGGDGVITASELALYLRQVVEVAAAQRANVEQTPQLWPLNKHRKGEYIFLVPGHVLNLPSAEALTERNNPYRGLWPYEHEHRELFYGRKEEIEALLALLEGQPFVAVLGASGTGKSSLVKAGLLPRLKDAGGQWQVLPPIRPTDHPVQALAVLLRGSLPGVPVALDADDGLAQAVAGWQAANPQKRLVLTVDQCEELITLCRDEQERTHFLTLLASAVRLHPDVFRLIVTLRTDFEPQLTGSTLFTDHGSRLVRYVIPPMDQDALRDVIEGPASVRVLYFEPPELVDELINEVVQMPGALPLLSFTLSEMFVRYVRGGRDDRALTLADYQAVGGVIGSLRRRANEEYDCLPDDAHRATMQRVMLRMISAEGGSELTRRRVLLSELEYPTAEENVRVKTVLDRMVAARLLVRGGADVAAGAAPDSYVEPAHDALVIAWDQLLQWKRAAEEYLPLQRRIAQAATEWAHAPEKAKAGLLWNDDPRLPQVERTLAPPEQGMRSGPLARVRRTLWPDATAPRDTAWLNRHELAFVQASVLRRAAVLKRIVGITAAVMVALAGLALIAFVQAGLARENAAQARTEANARATEVVVRSTAQADAVNAAATAVAENRLSRARELAANAVQQLPADPELGRLLAIESARIQQTAEGEEALRQGLLSPARTVLRGHTGGQHAVAFSPDSRLLLTSGTDRQTLLWDISSGKQLRGIDDLGTAMALRFTPDGRYMITTGGPTRIWETETGRKVADIPASAKEQCELQISPDGRYLLMPPGQDVGLWEIATGQQVAVMKGHSAGVNCVAFSPDGAFAASASDDFTARVWRVPSGIPVATLAGHAGKVVQVSFSPDGQRVLTGSADMTARTWEVFTGKNVLTLQSTGAPLTDARFSPDGRYIATTSLLDGMVWIWKAEDGTKWSNFGGGTNAIVHIAFSPDSSLLAAAITAPPEATVIRLWHLLTNTNMGVPIFDLRGNASWINDVAISPDGRFIATAGDDSTARTWDISLGRTIRTLAGQTTIFTGQHVWSPDGKEIVATTDNGTARIYDADTGTLRRELVAPGVISRDASFSPAGARVVTWNAMQNTVGPAHLWNPQTGDLIATLDAVKGSVHQASFSPDGSLVATRDDGPGVRLWTASTGELTRYMAEPTDRAISMMWSANGRRIMVVQESGGIRVYDPTSGQILATIDRNLAGARVIALSPDGRYAVIPDPISGSYPTVSVWDADTSKSLFTLVGHTGPIEGAEFSPDGRLIATAGGDYTARLWDARTGQMIATLVGHTMFVNRVQFSPDGRFLTTSSSDDTARIWNVSTGQLMMVLYGSTSDVRSAEFSPDGRWVVVGGEGLTSRVYRCLVCDNFDELLEATRDIVTRELTQTERQKFLHETARADITQAVAVGTPTRLSVATLLPATTPTAAPSPTRTLPPTSALTRTPARTRIPTAATVTPTPTLLPASSTPTYPEALIATGQLRIGQELPSANRKYSFRVQSDGDLVVYDSVAGRFLWSSGTRGSQADHLVMQNDGNLVLYAKDGALVWQSGTGTQKGDFFLIMQDDGNLVLYQGRRDSAGAVAIWAAHPEALIAPGQLQIGQELPSANRKYSFRFQPDGDLVVYNNVAGRSLWSSGTRDSQADHLVMQNDGNLVLYAKDGSLVWQSGTGAQMGDNFLLMQDDGNLVLYQGRLYREGAVAKWATNTNR